MYSCGPTVYDHAHIGNLRSFITADVLYRTLSSLENDEIMWVINFTDIDDKIIARLTRDYPDDSPEEARVKLTSRYEQAFRDDISKVGINPKTIKFVSATDYIERMQSLIRHLLEVNIAYILDGSIYFSLERYKQAGHKYGILQNVDFAAEARPTDDQDQKEGAADFALWKAKKEGEPSWDFELSGKNLAGRPGWHIECTAMSTELLGPEFDIHTGGIDLKFPHHENEIAQNEGRLARYFVHNEFLLVDNAKMSKSLNNFYTLEDIDDPIAFRYLCLQAHYRSQMNYTATSLNAAQARLKHLRRYSDEIALNQTKLAAKDSSGAVKAFESEFDAAMRDDLNTPAALAAFNHVEGRIYVRELLPILIKIDKVLALNLIGSKDIPQDIQTKLTSYDGARAKKDFEQSDKLRIELSDAGYNVSDTEHGSLISRI